MLRKLFSILIVMLCAGAMAHAQVFGGTAGGQTPDCTSPANASSPACGGTSTGLFGGLGQPMTPGAGGYGGGAYPQQQMGPGAAGVTSGINANVPPYVDGIPYGRQLNGAYNTYNPYTGLQQQQPLTEFQRVVAGSIGAVLPVFGADLFSNTGTLFNPIDRLPVTPDYVIGTGDQLLIRIWGQVNLNAHVMVDRAGDIYIPQAGNIEVAGLHFEQVDGYLKDKLARVFRNFDLSVNMGQLRLIQVYIVGNARRPGGYTLSSLSTLVNALFSSGGPSEQGSMRQIELKRGGKLITTFDLYDLLIKGDKSHDAPLLPGDVIYIPPVGPRVAIAGSVHVPAIYELKSTAGELNGTETAGQAIELAGGLSTVASKQDSQLDRIDSQGVRHTVQLTLAGAGLLTPLRDGDILRVPSIVQRFERTVTLRGNVANPGRYRWTPGMRILDLIPDREALETRGYWQRRIALGLPAPEYTPLFLAYRGKLSNPLTPGGGGTVAGQNGQNGQSGSASPANYTTGVSLADTQTQGPNPQDATEARAYGPQAAQAAAAGGLQTSAANNQNSQQSSPNGVNQGQSYNPDSDVERPKPGSIPQLLYFPPGERFSQGQFPIKNEILRTSPTIDWSYAAIERTNPHDLTTSIVPFSLGQAVLDHDPSQDLKLEPGDIVTIFSTADIHVPQSQQVRYVRLEGEIAHPGIYSVHTGETLRDVVRRAGGLTPNAYLYGSEFLRESTQRHQQAQLNEYVNTIERDIQVSAANASGSLVNPIGASALGTSIQSQRDLVTTLRKIRATGRIVLNVTAYSHGVDALPSLDLEDGDHFVVPVIPATVNVVGAVYDQNSFLYKRGQHVGQYIHAAGGGMRDADTHHEFVIRADGSVVSRQTAGGTLFAAGFDNKLAYPGDTVVVPDNVSKTSVLRNLTDFATVLSGFGIGIGALFLLGV